MRAIEHGASIYAERALHPVARGPRAVAFEQQPDAPAFQRAESERLVQALAGAAAVRFFGW